MRKSKRFGCLLLINALLLSGCSKITQNNNNSIPTPNEEITEVVTPTVTTSPSEGVENGMNEYPPIATNELHKIEDNYRTYYEVFLYSFCDSNGDGIGDINGLISKLDYLNDNDPSTDSDLGIDGIWLMPIMPSDTYHKYDVNDYYSIDPSYGTLEDFKTLLSECEKRGIKVIIDFIFNHTSDENPWFVEATDYIRKLPEGKAPDSKECPYIDFYNFEKDKADSSTYYRVGMTDWYYEAVFWNEMPDLNLSSDMVRGEIEKIASYWLDLGVGGFRLDAAKEYFTGSPEKNIEVLSWFTNFCKEKDPNCYLVAEVWDSFGTIASYYESGIDSIFNYAYGDSVGKIASAVKTAGLSKAGYNLASNMVQVQTIFESKNPNYIDASFVSNHDNNRAAAYVSYDEDKVKLLGGINLFMNGSSFLYYGEEIGLSGVGKDENKRAPMLWSDTDKTGITMGPPKMERQEQHFPGVDAQSKDSSSILNYYRKAIRLRNENPEIARGKVEMIPMSDQDIAAVTKTYEGSSIIVLYNLSPEEKQLTLSKKDYSYESIRGALTTTAQQPSLLNELVTLPAYAIVILK